MFYKSHVCRNIFPKVNRGPIKLIEDDIDRLFTNWERIKTFESLAGHMQTSPKDGPSAGYIACASDKNSFSPTKLHVLSKQERAVTCTLGDRKPVFGMIRSDERGESYPIARGTCLQISCCTKPCYLSTSRNVL